MVESEVKNLESVEKTLLSDIDLADPLESSLPTLDPGARLGPSGTKLFDQLLEDIGAMYEHARGVGTTLPKPLVDNIAALMSDIGNGNSEVKP